MELENVLTLIKAGYTKAEIEQFSSGNAQETIVQETKIEPVTETQEAKTEPQETVVQETKTESAKETNQIDELKAQIAELTSKLTSQQEDVKKMETSIHNKNIIESAQPQQKSVDDILRNVIWSR